jgi:hypothetical protein
LGPILKKKKKKKKKPKPIHQAGSTISDLAMGQHNDKDLKSAVSSLKQLKAGHSCQWREVISSQRTQDPQSEFGKQVTDFFFFFDLQNFIKQ